MNKKLFSELKKSIAEGGKILAGKKRLSRVFDPKKLKPVKSAGQKPPK